MAEFDVVFWCWLVVVHHEFNLEFWCWLASHFAVRTARIRDCGDEWPRVDEKATYTVLFTYIQICI
jgi:hypothetical protein